MLKTQYGPRKLHQKGFIIVSAVTVDDQESIKLSLSWENRLKAELHAPYMKALRLFLAEQIQQKITIYPKPSEWFAAFHAVQFEQVKVVIVGQDPYHGEDQAHGLSFSVHDGVSLPPSLRNIYKELEADLGVPPAKSGSLLPWASQGVLLLNSVLTVEAGRAASHQGKGWEIFTDRVIHKLAEGRDGLVFVLWGAYAQKKGAFIDRKRHFVIESAHPSPLSAYRGFFGSRPFSRINDWFIRKGEAPIDWRL
jgi:uracil-DNA glycosylase